MRKRLNTLRNVALGAGIVVALAFGTTEAWASDPCTPLPPHSCKYESNPDFYCTTLCGQNGYFPPDGACLQEYDCCVCLE